MLGGGGSGGGGAARGNGSEHGARPDIESDDMLPLTELVPSEVADMVTANLPKELSTLHSEVADMVTANLPNELSTLRMQAQTVHVQQAGPTEYIQKSREDVLRTQQGARMRAVKVQELGKGGYGVVSLCQVRRAKQGTTEQGVPDMFALKELKAPKPFPVGTGAKVQDFLPLQEAAIQQFMTHPLIVGILWADVRCLHPDDEGDRKALQLSVSALQGPNAAAEAAAAIQAVEPPLKRTSSSSRLYSKLRNMLKRSGSSKDVSVRLQMRMGLEYCDLGSLVSYLARNADVSDGWSLRDELMAKHSTLTIKADDTMCALLAALDVAEALRFMHKSKVLHGDLKPHNVLLTSNPQSTDGKGFTAKLSDFGFSRHLEGQAQTSELEYGTPEYLPLEAKRYCKLTDKADTFAMGMLMWEMFHVTFAPTVLRRQRSRKAPERLECSRACPARLARLVASCLDVDPDARPTAAQLVNELNTCISEWREGQAGGKPQRRPARHQRTSNGGAQVVVRRSSTAAQQPAQQRPHSAVPAAAQVPTAEAQPQGARQGGIASPQPPQLPQRPSTAGAQHVTPRQNSSTAPHAHGHSHLDLGAHVAGQHSGSASAQPASRPPGMGEPQHTPRQSGGHAPAVRPTSRPDSAARPLTPPDAHAHVVSAPARQKRAGFMLVPDSTLQGPIGDSVTRGSQAMDLQVSHQDSAAHRSSGSHGSAAVI